MLCCVRGNPATGRQAGGREVCAEWGEEFLAEIKDEARQVVGSLSLVRAREAGGSGSAEGDE